MFKRYAQLVTFQEPKNQLMRQTFTKGRYFTVEEWNKFTTDVYGTNTTWTVVNIVTMTY